ncbi:hypothetical protein [Janthinobacterium fluminis]|uniref:TIGR02391 family protein n=1 Tax=Janthinobacterium fluminis TaxID=2987524 RepID=A0ABT5JYX2_9BURK|nr:hypothetical protein [Janthinobacterium fluminis]MDC8757849.1 hypothetical protein [Janthinobacterium fluminis]
MKEPEISKARTVAVTSQSTPSKVSEIEPYVQKLIEEHRPALEQIGSALLGFLNQAGSVIRLLHSTIQKSAPQIIQLLEGIRAMPQVYRQAILELGQSGWYFDGNMPLHMPMEIAALVKDDKLEEVDAFMDNYFGAHLDHIEQELTAAFPLRAKIICAAFSAHRNGQFELSVPVLLTQVDGICAELTGLSPFRRKDKRPTTAAYVESLQNAFLEALLVPFSENLPISSSEHERPPHFASLNRHMVLHGESVDYATKRNSLKAISLLNYTVQYLLISKEESSRQRASAST